MNYSAHKIVFLKPKAELERDLDRIFPKAVSKRKDAFMLMADGMTVGEWLKRVAANGHKKVSVRYITACYERKKLVKLLS